MPAASVREHATPDMTSRSPVDVGEDSLETPENENCARGVKRKLDVDDALEPLGGGDRPALGDIVRIRDTPHVRKSMPRAVGLEVTITGDDKGNCPFRVCREREEAPQQLRAEDVSLVARATVARNKSSYKRVLEFSAPKLKLICADSVAFMNFHRALQTCIQACKGENAAHYSFEFNGQTISSEAQTTSKVDVTFQPGETGLKFKSHSPRKVKKVSRDSRADSAGVKKGWVILTINGRPFSEALLQEQVAGNSEFVLTFEYKQKVDEDVGFLSQLSVGDVVTYSSNLNRSYGHEKSMCLKVTGACFVENTAGETPWEKPKFFDDSFLPRCVEATSKKTRDVANWRLCHMRFDILAKPETLRNADSKIIGGLLYPSESLWGGSDDFARQGPGKHRKEAIVSRMSLDLANELKVAKASDDSLSDVKIERA